MSPGKLPQTRSAPVVRLTPTFILKAKSSFNFSFLLLFDKRLNLIIVFKDLYIDMSNFFPLLCHINLSKEYLY
jgi:hypothetical protein